MALSSWNLPASLFVDMKHRLQKGWVRAMKLYGKGIPNAYHSWTKHKWPAIYQQHCTLPPATKHACREEIKQRCMAANMHTHTNMCAHFGKWGAYACTEAGFVRQVKLFKPVFPAKKQDLCTETGWAKRTAGPQSNGVKEIHDFDRTIMWYRFGLEHLANIINQYNLKIKHLKLDLSSNLVFSTTWIPLLKLY